MARLHKTLADYAVIAISPALIMILIGSLVCFLIQAFYEGEYDARLRWIFGCYVFAAVLVSRIAIDEGREHAVFFAIPLALAMLLALSKFVQLGLFANLGLMALIWWCADKLVWDCTVIDERADASGKGLLQTVGLERPQRPQPAGSGPARAARRGRRPAAAPPESVSADQDPEATSSRAPATAATLWGRFLAHRRRAHAPGVWVVYISLLALPLFGIGQRFIPPSDLAGRRSAFWLLCYFAASALGLLLTSSFLNLRRYLRKRRLEMPPEMAGVWLGTGGMLILVVLVLCMALPRPHPEYTITQANWRIGSPEGRQASRHAAGRDGAQDPQDRARNATVKDQPADRNVAAERAHQQDSEQGRSGDGGQSQSKEANGQSTASEDQASSSKQQPSGEAAGDQPAQSAEPAGGGQSQQQQQSAQASGDKSHPPSESQLPGRDAREADGSRQSQKSDPPEEASQSEEAPPSQTAPAGQSPRSRLPNPMQLLNNALGSIPYLLKGLYYLIVLVIVGYLVWRYWAEIWTAIHNFLAAIRDFWAGIFGVRSAPRDRGPAEPTVTATPPRSFSAFPDPFTSGEAGRLSPRDLVVYSFHALEAWGREHNCPRAGDQTPHEFAARLAAAADQVGREARGLADLYCAVAYSQQSLAPASVTQLRSLWQSLRTG